MTELTHAEAVIIAPTPTPPPFPKRKTIVYQTLVELTQVRIEAEKHKHKLFRKYVLQLNNHEEIEFVSVEKFYEPYVVISGKYYIDYYRQRQILIRVDREVKEIMLLGQKFLPEISGNACTISLEGEERLIKENRAFLILDKQGKDSQLHEPVASPPEKDAEKLIAQQTLPQIPEDLELDIIQKRIGNRPADAYRIMNESLEIDERSLIYAPRFRVTYQCQKIEKKASIVLSGVNLSIVTTSRNPVSAIVKSVLSTKTYLLSTIKKSIMATPHV